jgi:NADH-quinone oxidoreductase subunit J
LTLDKATSSGFGKGDEIRFVKSQDLIPHGTMSDVGYSSLQESYMTLSGFLFYIIAATVVAATGVAITRRNLVHAVVYLIFSYFGTAMLFYLLGAPLLAALEVIIYAGAIMVLFLFVVIMIRAEHPGEVLFPLSQWVPAAAFGLIYLVVAFLTIFSTTGADVALTMLWATPREFALYVFQNYWFFIEVISMLLLIGLIGALQLGKTRDAKQAEEEA